MSWAVIAGLVILVKKKTTLNVPNQTYPSKGQRQTSTETTQEAQHELYAEARNGFKFFKKPFKGKHYKTDHSNHTIAKARVSSVNPSQSPLRRVNVRNVSF